MGRGHGIGFNRVRRGQPWQGRQCQRQRQHPEGPTAAASRKADDNVLALKLDETYRGAGRLGFTHITMRSALRGKADIGWEAGDIAERPAAAFQFMDLRRSNRKKVNSTTDECPDDRTINADILKVAAEDQFETVGYSPRVPVPHNLSDPR